MRERRELGRSLALVRDRLLRIENEFRELTGIGRFAHQILQALEEAAATVLAGKRPMSSGAVLAVGVALAAGYELERARISRRIAQLYNAREAIVAEQTTILGQIRAIEGAIRDDDARRRDRLRTFENWNCQQLLLTRTY